MMINKNKFRISNDKKILHKVGKRWVTVSALALAIIGGGALMSSPVTHADTKPAVSQQTVQAKQIKPSHDGTAVQVPKAGSQQNGQKPEQTTGSQSKPNTEPSQKQTPATPQKAQTPAQPVKPSSAKQGTKPAQPSNQAKGNQQKPVQPNQKGGQQKPVQPAQPTANPQANPVKGAQEQPSAYGDDTNWILSTNGTTHGINNNSDMSNPQVYHNYKYYSSNEIHDWQYHTKPNELWYGLSYRYSPSMHAIEFMSGNFTWAAHDTKFDASPFLSKATKFFDTPATQADGQSIKFDPGINTTATKDWNDFLPESSTTDWPTSLDLRGIDLSSAKHGTEDLNNLFDENSGIMNLVMPKNIDQQAADAMGPDGAQPKTVTFPQATPSGEGINGFLGYNGENWYRKDASDDYTATTPMKFGSVIPAGTYVLWATPAPKTVGATVYYIGNGQSVKTVLPAKQFGTAVKASQLPNVPSGMKVTDPDQQIVYNGSIYHVNVTKVQPVQPAKPSSTTNTVKPNSTTNPIEPSPVPNVQPDDSFQPSNFNWTGFQPSQSNTSATQPATVNVQPAKVAPAVTGLKQRTVKPERTARRSQFRYLMVTKPVLIHTDVHSVGKVTHYYAKITPRQRVTLRILRIVRSGKVERYEVSYRGRTGYVTANRDYVRNAYLQRHDLKPVSKIKLLADVYEYKSAHYTKGARIRPLRKGKVLEYRRIKTIAKGEMTRIQLMNGHWVTANRNFVKVVK